MEETFQSNTLDWSSLVLVTIVRKAKEKYQRVFEIQRSGDKTSSGKIGLDIRTCKSQSGTGPGVRRSKRPPLACCTRSMETLHN